MCNVQVIQFIIDQQGQGQSVGAQRLTLTLKHYV